MRWRRPIKHPVILKNYPVLTDLLSVQPMNEPKGRVFYLDFKYTDKYTDKKVNPHEFVIEQK
jgi:hypothetical protein